jgi:hypothetical protein
MQRKFEIFAVRIILFILGIIAWFVAAWFGLEMQFASSGGYDRTYFPNIAAGLTALGFSLAGGMCFIAASICDRTHDKNKP